MFVLLRCSGQNAWLTESIRATAFRARRQARLGVEVPRRFQALQNALRRNSPLRLTPTIRESALHK